jgi:hypothetical protein
MLPLLGWKPATTKSAIRCTKLFGDPVAPNLADVGGLESLRLAGAVYRALGVTRETTSSLDDGDSSSGAALERGIESDIAETLAARDPGRAWVVRRSGEASDYSQFRHLKDLQRLFEQQPTLRATLGHDYQVRTDVYVGVEHPEGAGVPPFLHAAISSKWTIRSDRVQNVRHEFATLVRNRRGRLPHLVLVTAEPLPSRLISIARGTGEVDAVYHLLFDELAYAVAEVGTDEQRSRWTEMVEQERLRPYSSLSVDLTLS